RRPRARGTRAPAQRGRHPLPAQRPRRRHDADAARPALRPHPHDRRGDRRGRRRHPRRARARGRRRMIGPLTLLRDLGRALDAAGRRLRGDYEEDEWGFDPSFAAAADPLLSFLYDRWWRITATGTEHVPREGRALLVANHAGVLPWDAAMMATALRRAGIDRAPRFLVLDWAFELPWASMAIRRNGGVPASPYNAL